jgi:hypothetical protein
MGARWPEPIGAFGRPKSGNVASAFLAMGFAATRETAQQWAEAAAERGATDDDLAAAWCAWEQITAYDVQTVGDDRCLCSHVHTGRCPNRACGCTRPRSTR